MPSSDVFDLSPATVLKYTSGGTLQVRSGWGAGRGVHAFPRDEGAQAAAVLTAGPRTEPELLADIKENLGLTTDEAAEFFNYLVDEGVLTNAVESEALRILYYNWSARGWRQPAIHTIAGFGLPFMPDEDGGANYDDVYREMLEDKSVPPQPPAVKGIPNNYSTVRPLPKAPPGTSDHTLQDVLESAKQVYAYEPHNLSLDEVHCMVNATFRNQRVISSGLGDALLRAYPSGGARHPLEAYIIAKGANDHEPGVYYFNPDDGNLYLINSDPNIAQTIDNACFLKRGVRSSNFAVAISIRWIRHIWKYRYSRSYRMVLLELGHALQDLSLKSLAREAEAYYCPSFNDSVLNGLCQLEDPYVEGVGMVMAIGRNGLTLEQYREAYDTNA